jgi:3-methylcrotonyl-CoA carboxylase alpha subunit
MTYHAQGWDLSVGGIEADVSVTARDAAELSIKLGATSIHGTVRRDGDVFHVFTGGRHFQLAYDNPMAHAGEVEAAGGRLTAPMPGKVVAVLASKGQQVKKGDPLVIMEAMKMEHTIAAPSDGLVEEILYEVGDQVADGAPLLAFKTA